MKWYSVKKYKPAYTVTTCFVKTEGGSLYVANNVEMSDGGYVWEDLHNDEAVLEDVTHFAIPDPVEIEE